MTMRLEKPEAHLDQFLRQTRAHHVQLSVMADFKANMLITIATLVATFSVGYLDTPLLEWPVLILISFCLPTILCAIYAVMPKLYAGPHPSKETDLADPSFNLLFFGCFAGMTYDEYRSAMEDAMTDPARVYELMIREVYDLGEFLMRKKYRYLRFAYLFFMIGIFASGIALGVQICR